MKITKEQLKKIIREAVKKQLQEKDEPLPNPKGIMTIVAGLKNSLSHLQNEPSTRNIDIVLRNLTSLMIFIEDYESRLKKFRKRL